MKKYVTSCLMAFGLAFIGTSFQSCSPKYGCPSNATVDVDLIKKRQKRGNSSLFPAGYNSGKKKKKKN